MVHEFLGNFYGFDSLVNFLNVLVALLISYQSHKIYKIIKNNNYKYFSWSFLSIAIAYLFKIISNITVVHRVIITNPNFVSVIVREFSWVSYVQFISYTFYKLFLLAGFLTLFLLMTKNKKKEGVFLFAYLSLITLAFSIYFNFTFHLTIAIILIAITVHFHRNHMRNKTKESLKAYIAFVFILAGSIVDIFYGLNKIAYLLGEIFTFTGFVVLLLNHIRIKNVEKKNKA